jgi:hypothetical protein
VVVAMALAILRPHQSLKINRRASHLRRRVGPQFRVP